MERKKSYLSRGSKELDHEEILCNIAKYLPIQTINSLSNLDQRRYNDELDYTHRYEGNYRRSESPRRYNDNRYGSDNSHRLSYFNPVYDPIYPIRQYPRGYNRLYQIGPDENTPEVQAIKDNMVALSKTTQPGEYYPDAQVPVDINGFREDMLKIGNLAREDPDYRKKHGEKEATDLSGDTVTIGGQEEKIYKHHPTPPYFDDLVLNDTLNKAAQFQAEYLASTKKDTALHYGPDNYEGKTMNILGDRINYFGYPYGVEGEGISTLWDSIMTRSPETFFQGDTHFRPWFNIGTDVREMGIGVAYNDGIWYTVVVAGTGVK